MSEPPGTTVTADKNTEGVKAGTGSDATVKPGGSATVPGTSGSSGGGGGHGGGGDSTPTYPQDVNVVTASYGGISV